VSPAGSFTDPEHGQAGLGEKKARETHDVVIAVVRFDSPALRLIAQLPLEGTSKAILHPVCE
jgi:hypothetical protein